jgi:ABC-2 type transport system ATP-binding protein
VSGEQSVIETEGLGRRFGALTAVEGVSLRVAAGEVLALLGPNGAGKTTTMQMLAALLAPSTGSARVAGHDVAREADAVRARVGIMLDEPGFYGEMALEGYLLFFARLYGLRPTAVRAHLDDLLDRFGLAPKRGAKLDTLSKGMRQKVSLARALLHKPPVLLLDEPTSALDPLSARAVQEYILERRQAGDAIIISTHNLPEAERLADRVAIVARGQLRRQGTPAELRRLPDGSEPYALTLAGPWLTGPSVPRLGTDGPAHRDGHLAALRTLDGVRDLTLVSSDAEEHTLSYRTSDARRANAAIVAAAVGRGAAVVSLAPRPRSLSEVYLETIEEAEG